MLVVMILTGTLPASDLTYKQGQDAYDSGDYQGAELIWEQLAETGDEESMFALGDLKHEGPGDAEVDYVASSTWFQKSAELGHPLSQYNLGNAYQKGLGVVQDDAKAAYWWQRAAAQGIPNAAYNLGVQYMDGRGVPQDYQQALKMFQFAAARGHASARKLLRSWNFEVPELEGSGAEDTEKLAGMAAAKTGSSTSGPADPVGMSGGAVVSSEEQQVDGASLAATAEPVEQVTRHADAAPANALKISQAPAIDDTDEPEYEAQIVTALEPVTTDAPVVAMQPQPEQIETIEHVIEKPTAGIPEPEQSDPEPTVTPEQPIVVGHLSAPSTGETYILGLPREYYTLQLTAMNKQSLVSEFIGQFELVGELHHYQYKKGADTYYALSIGTFSTRADAIAFRDQLAASNKAGWQNPWLRRISEIQNLIRAMHDMDQQ